MKKLFTFSTHQQGNHSTMESHLSIGKPFQIGLFKFKFLKYCWLSSSLCSLTENLINNHRTSQEIAEIALDQTGLPNQRKLAFVDKNRDLFLTNIRFSRTTGGSNSSSPGKLGSMVQSIKWNSGCNMLASVQARITVAVVVPLI